MPSVSRENDSEAVIYRDAKWLVIDKPFGISTHAATAGDLGLVEWWALHRDERLHVISRLDKATSGVLVFARTPEASAQAQAIHERGDATKTYQLLTDRPVPAESWAQNDPLDDQAATTTFRVCERRGNQTLLEARIARGRRHQIRRHAELAGVPILGDDLYGGGPFPRLCLHCVSVEWPGLEQRCTSPTPESFGVSMREAGDLAIDAAVAAERRGQLLDGLGDCARLVHRGELHQLECSIDRYGAWLLVSGFDESLSARHLSEDLAPLLDSIASRYAVRGALIRNHQRDPHHRRLVADTAIWGDRAPEQFWVQEHGIPFEIAFDASKHPGLFLDQRDNRRRVALASQAKRVANLFAFTGSFSSAALASGAEVVVSVDLAAACLETAKRNFQAAGLEEGGRGKFVRGDVREWLSRQKRKRDREGLEYAAWDWLICDPPVFAAARKGKSFSVEQDWRYLASDARDLISDEGLALFSNNHRHGDARRYRTQLDDCFADVVTLRPPLDFPQREGSPDHVRSYLCRKPRR